MAKQLGARKESFPIVICATPSVTLSPSPVPYPIVYKLDKSIEVSKDVRFNKHYAFHMSSNTANVTGDEAGIKGGVISQTTSKKAEPIKHSKSVKINKKWAVRCGDTFNMNNKNTFGTLVCPPPASKPAITDSGKISIG